MHFSYRSPKLSENCFHLALLITEPIGPPPWNKKSLLLTLKTEPKQIVNFLTQNGKLFIHSLYLGPHYT